MIRFSLAAHHLSLAAKSTTRPTRRPVLGLQRGRSPYTRLIASLMLVPLLLFGLQPVTGQTPAPKPPPVQTPRSHDYHVEHYKIELAVDMPNKSIAGQTTITLKPVKSELKEVDLDAGQMNIGSVKLASGAPLKFRYNDQEKLYVELDRPYPAGASLAIVIAYSAKPTKGLTFISPGPNDPKRPNQVWSQGEAETNHYWFPCYDYPNDKATSETIVTVEDKYQVISNGTLLSVKRDPVRKTVTYHWKMDQPFSSYLISVVVGEFAEVKQAYAGIPLIS